MSNKKSTEGSKCGFQRKSEDLIRAMPSTPPSVSTPSFGRRLTEFRTTPDCFSAVSIDSPLMKNRNIAASADFLNTPGPTDENYEDSSLITVGVRVRPFTQRELLEDAKCIVSTSGNETLVTLEKGDVSRFTYDYSFWSFDEASSLYADQRQVYEALAQPLLAKVLEGYNTCLFAYGQTGSGKSYSIMGHGKDAGIVPRFCEELFDKIHENDSHVNINVEISFFEIYNEKIHDLLGSSHSKDKSHKKPNLKVREHPVLGPFVDGLSSYVVKSFEDVETWLNVGNKRRATAATGMNDSSSRSHSVFTLVVTQTKTSVIEETVHKHNVTSRINLVDLAGSERQSTAKTSGDRLREGASINKSLMALGKVISLLSDQSSTKRKCFIPYRETILTWLLKESLGGNSKTSMLATISPSNLSVEETLSTLRYARQARNIVNNARINEDQNARYIRNLQAEIEKLRMLTGGNGGSGEERCLIEIKYLKEELMKKEQEVIEMNRLWQDKLERSEACKEEEARLLKKSGVSLEVNSDLPCLVNLNEDPQLNEVLLYTIKMGKTKVGRLKDDCDLDIQLSSALICDEHCVFDFDGQSVKLTPLENAAVYVNGQLLSDNQSVVVQNGDRIVLAGDHFFRFINPLEENLSNGTTALHSLESKDFYFAYQEFTTKQNARLEAELTKVKERYSVEVKMLEAEKMKVKADMEQQLTDTRQKRDDLKNRLDVLQRVLNEGGKDRVLALDQVKKLEVEKQLLERKLSLAKLTQSQIEVTTTSYKSDWLDFMGRIGKKFEGALSEYNQNLNGVNRKDESFRILQTLSEANNICKLLNKDIKFLAWPEKESPGVKVTAVKVLRVQLDISTFWPLDKFEEKLDIMRDSYKGRMDEKMLDEVLFDHRDAWESESRISTSPALTEQHVRRSLSLQSTAASSILDCSVGSLDLSFSDSFAHSPNQSIRAVNPKIRNDFPASEKVFSQFLSISLQEFKEFSTEDSMADKILFACQRIFTFTKNLPAVSVKNPPSNLYSELSQSLALFVHSYNSLQSLSSHWLVELSSSQSDIIIESKESLHTSVSNLGSSVHLFLQGLENDLPAVVENFDSKIIQHLVEICSTVGKLSVSCQLDCFSLRSVQLSGPNFGTTSKTVDVEVKNYFLNGCNEFAEQALRVAVTLLEEKIPKTVDICRNKKSKFARPLHELLRRSHKAVSSAALLLTNLEKVQSQLNRSSEGGAMPTDNSDYFLASYDRCKSLCLDFSGIVDCSMQLINLIEWMTSGENVAVDVENLKLTLEAIECHTNRIVSATGLTATRGDADTTYINDSQMKLLEMAADEVKVAVNDLSTLAMSDDV